MIAASRQIADRIANFRMPLESRSARSLLLAVAIVAFFSIGWLTRSARQTDSAPWTPARPFPSATIIASESTSPPIAMPRPAPPVREAKHRRTAPTTTRGSFRQRRQAATAETQTSTLSSQPTAAPAAPSSSSAPNGSPTSSDQGTGSTSPQHTSAGPSSSHAGSGQAGSFDSSG